MDHPAHSARPVAVVTGGASGLGLAIARNLAESGHDVAVVARNAERLARAVEVLSSSSRGGAVHPILTSDLALQGEVRRVADLLLDRFPRIGLLVNNAGAIFARRTVTEEGIERTWALNVLAPFALTYRLGPALGRAGRARVVNVSSAAHRGQRLDLSDVELVHGYRSYRAYGRSKLALLALTRAFARRWQQTDVAAFAVHPGFVRTRFGRNNPGLLGGAFYLAETLFGIGVAAGARTPTFAALDGSLNGHSGAYLSREKIRPGSHASRDVPLGEELFRLCREATGLADVPLQPSPGVETGPR